MRDAFDEDFRQVGVVERVLVIGVELFNRHGNDFFVHACFVLHQQNADGATAHDGARHHGNAADDENVNGVAIVRQCVRDEAVVGGILHGRVDETINEQCARGLVHFIFHRMPAVGHFDDDIDVMGRIDADRDSFDTHLTVDPFVARCKQPQSQRIESDKAFGVFLVVSACIVFEGHMGH